MDREKIVKKIRESKLSENDILLYGSVLINEYAKTYHKKQLKLYDVVKQSEQFYCWDGAVGEQVCEKQCEDCRLDDRSKKQ